MRTMYEVTVRADEEIGGQKIMAITEDEATAHEIAANLMDAGYEEVKIPQLIEGGVKIMDLTNEEMIKMLIEAMHELPEKDFRSVCTHLYGVVNGAKIALEQHERASA